MPPKLPMNVFERIKSKSKFNERTIYFTKNYNQDNYFKLVIISSQLHKINTDLPFLPERMKTKKCDKPAANCFD